MHAHPRPVVLLSRSKKDDNFSIKDESDSESDSDHIRVLDASFPDVSHSLALNAKV